MAKQTLGVFTENELDRNYMCKILSQVFSSSLDIVPVPLPPYTRLRQNPPLFWSILPPLRTPTNIFQTAKSYLPGVFWTAITYIGFWNCPKVRQCWLQTSPDGLRRIW